MDTRENNTGWIVSGVLLVLLVIVGYLWLSSPKDVPGAVRDGIEQVANERDELNKACNGPDATKEDCDAKREEVAELLAEYNLETASSSATATTTVR